MTESKYKITINKKVIALLIFLLAARLCYCQETLEHPLELVVNGKKLCCIDEAMVDSLILTYIHIDECIALKNSLVTEIDSMRKIVNLYQSSEKGVMELLDLKEQKIKSLEKVIEVKTKEQKLQKRKKNWLTVKIVFVAILIEITTILILR